MTIQQQYKEQLEALGFMRQDHRSGKYIKMSHPAFKNSIFLGRSGAFRYGRIASETLAVRKPELAIKQITQAIQRKENVK